MTSHPLARIDGVSALCAAGSCGWLGLSLAPSGLPGWPAVSLGLCALACALVPGRALPRGAGAFFGLCGLLGGTAEIALYWTLSSFLL